jgi:hypothetical protein
VGTIESACAPGFREEGNDMFDVIFVVVTLAVLAVEIIEVRQKCEQIHADT